MISRIEIVCFTASYAVVLALELLRPWWTSRTRTRLAWGFGGAGLLAHTLYLINRALTSELPLSSKFDWYLVGVWLLAALYLYLSYYHPRQAIAVFVLPFALAGVVAALWADREPFPQHRSTYFWGLLHGGLVLAGTLSVMIGFVTGALYLVSAWRLKRHRPPSRGFPLPSLEWLSRINTRALVVAVLTLGLGVVSGVVLNVISRGRQVDAIPWSDPIVVSSGVTLVWMALVALFMIVYKPARLGRKVAYLTVASFAFLVTSLGVSLVTDTQHAAPREEPSAAPVSPQESTLRSHGQPGWYTDPRSHAHLRSHGHSHAPVPAPMAAVGRGGAA